MWKQLVSIARALLKDAPIVVLDNGSIVEQGSHSNLLAAKGLYARLWDIQQQADIWKMIE
ncbi:hypothetical protein ACFVVQ_06760 [Paenibacillus chitinolyticus]|uniref:hypothetical protein n=1 Tax=Paenibacillus chitinolyticus TaxID=79263 RepID=UPI0036DC1B7B